MLIILIAIFIFFNFYFILFFICNKQSKSFEEYPNIVFYILRQIDVNNVYSFLLALEIAIFALLFQ